MGMADGACLGAQEAARERHFSTLGSVIGDASQSL
jgi:hypothetical protein